MELASETTNIVPQLPIQEKYTYRDQIVRSSISLLSLQILQKEVGEIAEKISNVFFKFHLAQVLI
jgi:hypothetical protein